MTANVSAQELLNFRQDSLELYIRLECDQQKLNVVGLYRPPTLSVTEFQRNYDQYIHPIVGIR